MSRLLVFMFVLTTVVQGKLIEIKKEIATVIKHHNNERSNKDLKAADMMEMGWDDGLARQAGDYAERCRYKYPDVQEFDVGSNLYYQRNFVYGGKSVHRLVENAMASWNHSKPNFLYGPHCDRACSYVQMIVAQADKIGCALSTCKHMDTSDRKEAHASIFVCFYSPRQSLLSAFPYKTGYACSECPVGSICRDGLCSQIGYEALPAYLQDSPSDDYQAQQAYEGNVADLLTESEQYYLTSIHNQVRKSNNRNSLEWDSYLEGWAKYVVHCKTDYPGPSHCYTNFHRLNQGQQVYVVVYDWSDEGNNTYIDMDHGCRTPRDTAQCNHFTNMIQPTLTSIGCAAKDCKDNTRQLICIYDNKADREPRNPLQFSTAGRRRNRHVNPRRSFLPTQ